MPELLLKFPTRQDRDWFIGWFLDGGGEYQFLYSEPVPPTVNVAKYNYDNDSPEIEFIHEADD